MPYVSHCYQILSYDPSSYFRSYPESNSSTRARSGQLGLPIPRARTSMTRGVPIRTRTLHPIVAYILNGYPTLACSRASMSWLINPRARTLRARKSDYPSPDRISVWRKSSESSGFHVQSVSGSTRVHPSRACMFRISITLFVPKSLNPSKSRVRTCSCSDD